MCTWERVAFMCFRFVRDGFHRTKGHDIIHMLSIRFDKAEEKIRKQLIRHPHWCHVSALAIKSTWDSLLLRGFDNYSIYSNIHLLLYPM